MTGEGPGDVGCSETPSGVLIFRLRLPPTADVSLPAALSPLHRSTLVLDVYYGAEATLYVDGCSDHPTLFLARTASPTLPAPPTPDYDSA